MHSDALVTRVANGGHKRLYHVEEPGLRLIEDLAANGVNIRTIAHALKMDPVSFRNARDRQPEIDEAIGRGAARMKDELVGIVMAHARGGNLVAAMFALKAIFGLRDAGPVRPDEVSDGPTGGVLIVPAELTVAEYLAQKVESGDLERHPHGLIDVTPRSK